MMTFYRNNEDIIEYVDSVDEEDTTAYVLFFHLKSLDIIIPRHLKQSTLSIGSPLIMP